MPAHCSREETREKQSPANPTKGETAYSTAGHPEELQHAPLCLLALGLYESWRPFFLSLYSFNLENIPYSGATGGGGGAEGNPTLEGA